MANENLITLLLDLVEKAPYHTEDERQDALDLLREVEADMGVTDVVPPKAEDANQPAAAPDVPVPGDVAVPVPPDQQPPAPTSPEVADTSPEATNAFSGTDPGDVPGSP
jgi:hypothetical protein